MLVTRSPFTYVGSIDRRTVVWSVLSARGLDKATALKTALAETLGSAIVHAGGRAEAESILGMLMSAGLWWLFAW
jgi:hypothetical protein